MNDRAYRFVFIESQGVIGKVITFGAYASRVMYAKGGLVFDDFIDNDELTTANDFLAGYDNESAK